MSNAKRLLFFFLTLIVSLFPPAYASQIKTLKVSPHQVMNRHIRSSCVTGTLALVSPTNWYTQAQLTITNNCGSPQQLNNAVVSFQSNSNNITAMWGGANSSAAFTYAGNIASTVLNIVTGNVPVGKNLVMNFGINLTGTAFDLTSANSTLAVILNSPTPTNGEIDVTVNPSGVTGYSGNSEIDITGPGLTTPYVILNSSWNTSTTFKVTGLAYGTYTVTAQAISSLYLGNATPSSVSVNSGTPVPVSVTYTPAAATGALQINLGQAPIQNIASSVNATVTDNTTNQSQVVNVAWNAYTLVQNLTVGDNFSVSFPQVSNGLSYANPNTISNPVILQNRTTPLNVSYQQAQPASSQSVVFNVSGLPQGVQGALNIVDSYGNQFSQTGINNGEVTQALPMNDSFAVSASAPSMFATISPSSFVLTNGTPAPTVSVQYTANAPVSSANFFAYADTGLQSNHNGLVPPKGGNLVEAFILYNPWEGKSDLWAIAEGDPISQIVKNTPNTFASVGGANSPYPWDYESVAQGVSEIEALVDYYGFIGLDWDVEGAALETPSVQEWVSQAVVQIRKDRPNLILTLTVPDPVIGFTNGTMVILNQTLAANNNKMVFNWVNKMDFDENGLGNGCTQTDTNMNNNCLVISAQTGAQQLATLLNIDQQTAYQYLGEIFMIPSDDEGHPLSLALATQVATTISNLGVKHMGYWRLQNDDANLTYGNTFTHILGLS